MPEEARSLANRAVARVACRAAAPVRYCTGGGFLWPAGQMRVAGTLGDHYDRSLADAAHLARLRPRTVRAYRSR